MRIALWAVLSVWSLAATAQSWGPRTLEELKQETVRRAERNMGPIGGVKAEDAREAMGALQSLEPDAWAAVWSTIGERYFAAGDFYHAWHAFNVARWPSEKLSPGKSRAYARALEAFAQYGKTMRPPVETVRIPFEGAEIVAYLRVPEGAQAAPLVLGINGLDTRKEDVMARSDSYVHKGVAVLAVDMPGTGQAPIVADVGAERLFSKVLDWVQTRRGLDPKRVVVQGRSWSGYWAAVLAYTEKARLQGAVVHGVGIHEYYSPEWQKKAFSTREYLFDIFPARASAYGTKTMEEFLAWGPRLSLVARGLLDQPSAPMLLVNGERDTQQPIADLYLLMRHGDPKEVWVNPEGGHMGRSARWPDGRVAAEIVEPWVLRRLGVDTMLLAQAATEKPAAKKDDKPADAKAKPRPRVILKKEGAGEDAGGGGAHTGPSSMGGTPSTPSGSFTR